MAELVMAFTKNLSTAEINHKFLARVISIESLEDPEFTMLVIWG
jgi:hypothetical protein